MVLVVWCLVFGVCSLFFSFWPLVFICFLVFGLLSLVFGLLCLVFGHWSLVLFWRNTGLCLVLEKYRSFLSVFSTYPPDGDTQPYHDPKVEEDIGLRVRVHLLRVKG